MTLPKPYFPRPRALLLSDHYRPHNQPPAHHRDLVRLDGRTLYMLSGNGPRHRSAWVRNLAKTPSVNVCIRGHEFSGTARVVEEPAEDAVARRLLFEKYAPTYSGDLTEWRETALPVAVDLVA